MVERLDLSESVAPAAPARVALAGAGPVADALRADGYEVRTARDGDELLGLIAAWRPDLVVADSDIAFAGEVLERLRTAEESPPVIVAASSFDGASRDEALALGAAAVFPKPLDVDDLRTAAFNLAPARRTARVFSQPRPASQVDAALMRCIVALRDVAAGRAHPLIASSALCALDRVLQLSPAATPLQHHTASVLAGAFERFEATRGAAGHAARAALEDAALAVTITRAADAR